ncbi:hypothetical protein EIP86_006569 [Pleurotus ostreatoroseus]|nr:hypothetical protein EIP86_006569 [Pleurotus ostreatoroseus]
MEEGESSVGETVATAVDIPRVHVVAPEPEVASSAAGSSHAAHLEEEHRPQADPLPTKRGEIGFQERYLQQLADDDDDDGARSVATQSTLPARHPADRDESASAPTEPSNDNDAAAASPPETTPAPVVPPNKSFTSKQLSSLGGVHLSTFLLLVFQCALICATLVGWVLFGILSAKANSNSNNSSLFGASSAQIFGHVLFTIALLVQLVFLERRIYYLRAERYCYANPGLPMHTGRDREALGVGFAPWNRPSLPTYAAALAQSGVGTGDVEDNVIAIPPPPAYGNTRGSTLLLSGFISETLRAQRRDRMRSGGERSSVRLSRMSSRPVSYVSYDDEWEERRDRLRALALEDTLAKLEDARVSTQDGELRRGGSLRA